MDLKSLIHTTHNTKRLQYKAEPAELSMKEEKTSVTPLNFYRLSHRNTYPGHASQPVQSASPLPPSSTCLSLNSSAILLNTFKMKILQSGTFNPACKKSDDHCTARLNKASIPNPYLRGWQLAWTHRSRHCASLLPGTSVRILYQFFPLCFLTAATSICMHQTEQELKSSPVSTQQAWAAVLFASCANLCTKVFRSF